MTLKCFQHKGPFVIIPHIFLSIEKKKRDLWLNLQPRTYIIFTALLRLRAKRDVELLVMLWDQTRTQPSSLTGCCYIQPMFSLPPLFSIFQCRSLWRLCPGSPLLRPCQWSDPGWSAPTGHPRLPGPGRCHGTAGTEPGPRHTAADGPCGGPGSGWGRQTEGRHT